MQSPPLPLDDDDPMFQLSMTGMVAQAFGLVAMVWEMEDEMMYFSGAHDALGLPAASLTPAALRRQLHAGDLVLFDQALDDCHHGHTGVIALRLRLLGQQERWHHVDCRLKASERNEDGTLTRVMGLLSPML